MPYLLVLCHIQNKEYEKALLELDTIQRRWSQYAKAYALRADVYMQMKDTTQAFEALNKSIDDEYVGVSQKENSLVGKEGITETVLCPSGKVVIEGESYNAVSESGYLNEGVKVIVKKYATGQIYVKEIK